jgi:hypothetical protein
MPLGAALRKAQAERRDYVPIYAVRQAVVDGVIPSRRSSKKTRARYYIRWPVLLQYLDGLKQ